MSILKGFIYITFIYGLLFLLFTNKLLFVSKTAQVISFVMLGVAYVGTCVILLVSYKKQKNEDI